MDDSRATLIAASIGAVAALTAAYFSYRVGEHQLEVQRSASMVDFLVRTAGTESSKMQGVMNRICVVNSLPKEDVNALYKNMYGKPCPPPGK
jgi:uncharacterized membrane protein